MTELQQNLYRKIIKHKSKEIHNGDKGEGLSGTALSFITNLKKLCNHPQLIYNMCKEEEPGFQGKIYILIFNYFLGCLPLYPQNFSSKTLDPQYSGKMKVLDYILAITKKTTNDRFVLVSNYTQTMDAFVEVIFNFLKKLKFSCAILDVINMFVWMEACQSSNVLKLSNNLITQK